MEEVAQLGVTGNGLPVAEPTTPDASGASSCGYTKELVYTDAYLLLPSVLEPCIAIAYYQSPRHVWLQQMINDTKVCYRALTVSRTSQGVACRQV